MTYRQYMRECLQIALDEGTVTFTKEGFKQLYDETHKVIEAEKSGAFVVGAAAGGMLLGTVGFIAGHIMGQNN